MDGWVGKIFIYKYVYKTWLLWIQTFSNGCSPRLCEDETTKAAWRVTMLNEMDSTKWGNKRAGRSCKYLRAIRCDCINSRQIFEKWKHRVNKVWIILNSKTQFYLRLVISSNYSLLSSSELWMVVTDFQKNARMIGLPWC